MKSIAIIGTAGIPPRYGGFETLAGQLAVHLQHKFRLTVYCSSHLYSKKERGIFYESAKLVYLPFKPNGVQSIFYDLAAMVHACRRTDILLILGVSGCIFLPVIRLFFKGKIIVHPDGIEWKREKWSWFVRKFLKLSERLAVRNVNAVIADNVVIQDYLMEQYGVKPDLIEYGGNPLPAESGNQKMDNEFQLPESYYLALGRIEPENNPEMILQTFMEFSDRKLVFIGNWQWNNFGRKLYKKYHTTWNIYLLDPIYNLQLLDKIRSRAKVYIHGHSAGGTNPSLVEAMWTGLPVFVYDIAFNRTVTENKALYFQTGKALAGLLQKTTELQLKNNRISMTEIARRKYNWENIIEKYVSLLQKN